MKNLTNATLAALALAVLAGSANAADYRHLDRIALRITKNTEALFREFRYHYRHTSEYRHLISDARELRSHALHIHDVAHHRGSLCHLARDVRDMDRLFHHLENVVERVERSSHCEYHSGHIHGNTSHVARLMHAIEDDLHHLGEDVEGVAIAARYSPPIRTYRAPAPIPSRHMVPALPSRYHHVYGSKSIRTPFGLLTIRH